MSQVNTFGPSGGGGGGGFSSIVIQTFSVSGIYTPTAGMAFATIEAVGGGGGGAGIAGMPTGVSAGGGGGAGGYGRLTASAATIGASQTITIGAGGTGGASGGFPGNNGTATIVGTLFTANGGNGGSQGNIGITYYYALGGTGGTVTGMTDIAIPGNNGGISFAAQGMGALDSASGFGGSSYFGAGALPAYAGPVGGNKPGNNASIYGSGGSGAAINGVAGVGQVGGDGSAGFVIITEYIA